MRLSEQFRAKVLPFHAQVSLLPTPSWKVARVALSQQKWRAYRGGSGSKEGSAGTPNTDFPLAGGGQEGDTAQILSSQKKKKTARNRKRESCQLEAG